MPHNSSVDVSACNMGGCISCCFFRVCYSHRLSNAVGQGLPVFVMVIYYTVCQVPLHTHLLLQATLVCLAERKPAELLLLWSEVDKD